MLRTLAALAAAALLAAPAAAYHCPISMAKIDELLESGTTLSGSELETVKRLRAEGETLHESGRHGEAVKALDEALRMLGRAAAGSGAETP